MRWSKSIHIIYNQAFKLIDACLLYIHPIFGKSNSKLGLFIVSRHRLIETIRVSFRQENSSRPVIWVHASSYGEYNIARPIIKSLRSDKSYRVVLTFFSPTGLQMKPILLEEVDAVYPLPLDSTDNVSKFLDIINPQKVLFMVSEYWLNYLFELGKRNIPVYLLSANIKGNEPYFRWYGGIYKEALNVFKEIFVLNTQSKERLDRIGIHQVTVTGDPLFDNVAEKSLSSYHNTIIENFVGEQDVFIAGSIHNDQDLQLIASLANHHQETRFLIVPHEISEEILHKIIRELHGRSVLYSDCTEKTDFSVTQVLIVDFMGSLTYLYRYARWAYVGGGFTPYLHNVLEAVVYGIPVAFGPKIKRKPVAQDLMALGIGHIASTPKELDDWFTEVKGDEVHKTYVKKQSECYMREHIGQTVDIVQRIVNDKAL
ncbi:MAG: 3-deoxy-D-manno-octulosonic acid transferase [Bacteroidaceae bacterium]|nr:3-deoxy-D-manno-octulosonic acid transferase [Bacteroidaceae bacterium]MBQ9192017.1 3-deoxy-D-manno-octulosonic acid transferase [Bacteroidaceae bacterium]